MLNKNSALKIKQEEKFQSLNIKSTNANIMKNKNPKPKTRKIISIKSKINPNILKIKAHKIRRTKQKIERAKKAGKKSIQLDFLLIFSLQFFGGFHAFSGRVNDWEIYFRFSVPRQRFFPFNPPPKLLDVKWQSASPS